MKRTVLFALGLSALATAALAQEAIATRPADSPSPQASAAVVEGLDQPTQGQAQAAEWGRQVLARANGQLPPSDDRPQALDADGQARGCVRNPDRAPHGEVSVAAGSRGYRGASGVVTQPIGDCGQITIGISTERGGGYYGGGYGRRYR